LGKIKDEISKQFKEVFEEAIDKTYKSYKENVDYFYTAPGNPTPGNPPPGYDRTGQLGEAVQFDSCEISDTFAEAQLSLDISYKYVPSGRDTATIYGYAEDDGLLGNGGFYRKTVYDAEQNIKDSFSKYFDLV
jgi:hypothetical protein